jgi:hypothetical protein
MVSPEAAGLDNRGRLSQVFHEIIESNFVRAPLAAGALFLGGVGLEGGLSTAQASGGGPSIDLKIDVTHDTTEFDGRNDFLTVTNKGSECVTEDPVFLSTHTFNGIAGQFPNTLQPGKSAQVSMESDLVDKNVRLEVYDCSDDGAQGKPIAPAFPFTFRLGEWEDVNPPKSEEKAKVCTVPAILSKKPETISEANARIRKDPNCKIGNATTLDGSGEISKVRNAHSTVTLAHYAVETVKNGPKGKTVTFHTEKAGAQLSHGATLHAVMRPLAS